MAPLAMCIMEGTASAAEQHDYALRLIAAGERLQHRADETGGAIVDGEVLANGPISLPAHTAELAQGRRSKSMGSGREGRNQPFGSEIVGIRD